MTTFKRNLSILAAALLLTASPALAMDMEHGGHAAADDHGAAGGHDGHGAAMNHGGSMETEHGGDSMEMDHSGHEGRLVRSATVDGLALAYHLIDMKAKMAAMPGGAEAMAQMPEMKSHHLMLYVTGADGGKITDATVGYLVTGAAGQQKAMTMAMEGGYGADVELGGGEYMVKTKIVAGDKTVMDEFSLKVE